MQEKGGLLDNVVNDSQRGWSSHARCLVDFKFLLPRLKETFQAPAPALISTSSFTSAPVFGSTNQHDRTTAGWAGRCCDPGTRHHRHIPAQTFWRSSFGYAVVAMAPAPVSTWEVPATSPTDNLRRRSAGLLLCSLCSGGRRTNFTCRDTGLTKVLHVHTTHT